MKKIFNGICLIFLCVAAYSQSSSFQRRALLLSKSSQVENYYSIDNDGISIYASPILKKQNKPECKVYFDEIEQFQKLISTLPADKFKEIYKNKKTNRLSQLTLSSCELTKIQKSISFHAQKPLNGIRIAIDPGHLGGTQETAKIEGKFVSVIHENTLFELIEGNLTLATALILKDSLTKLGAEVLLTRSNYGHSVFGKTFEQWLAQDLMRHLNASLKKGTISIKKYSSLLMEKDKNVIFHHFFRDLEMIERAKKINQFRPDITLIIHFNIDEINWNQYHKKIPHYPLSSHNYNMAFVGGSFLPEELSSEESRIAFLRFLITDDLDNSILLSNCFIQACEQYLKNETFKDQQPLAYIQKYSLPTSAPGVFARNLLMTRLVRGTVCYGETLYQDNWQELHLLSQKPIVMNKLAINQRLVEVAQSYLHGVLEYVRLKFNSPSFSSQSQL
ncbi:MAG: N-acetylmuramoyl-L-alanine amidase [Cytophagales bacterium]|nr:N-acetylmuramoyl-L-alanine amidase [Cytophagales bacterium]MDW8384076.1 hypothetical protein [Flammeovirgaceae bacterium]